MVHAQTARPLIVLDPMTVPSTSPGILFNEDFVTVSVLEARLRDAREETETLHNVRCQKSLTCMARISRNSKPMMGGRDPNAAQDILNDGMPQCALSWCSIPATTATQGYACRSCQKCICSSCFPVLFYPQAQWEENKSYSFRCPLCRGEFDTFPWDTPVDSAGSTPSKLEALSSWPSFAGQLNPSTTRNDAHMIVHTSLQ